MHHAADGGMATPHTGAGPSFSEMGPPWRTRQRTKAQGRSGAARFADTRKMALGAGVTRGV